MEDLIPYSMCYGAINYSLTPMLTSSSLLIYSFLLLDTKKDKNLFFSSLNFIKGIVEY